MSTYVPLCAFFPSVQIPCGGLPRLWCLVSSDHLDVSDHIAAGKVSMTQASVFLCRAVRLLGDQHTA